jgi:ABC-2 type transport system permease protein
MNKYLLVIRNTWDEIVTYRLNFIMWRVRTILQILTVYFLWSVLIPQNGQIFGYTQSKILTYVLVSALVGSIVFATRTQEIGDNINSGDLSIFLIRPINYFGYWFAREIGDKAMNIVFSIVELMIMYIILRPPVFIQTDIVYLLLMAISIAFAVMLQFISGSLLGMIGFWSPEVWAPRFIYFILLSFLAGSIFPLDVLPNQYRSLMELLPFPYLLYFPLKIYLGQLSMSEVIRGMSIVLLWSGALGILLSRVWKKGLKEYAAVGR